MIEAMNLMRWQFETVDSGFPPQTGQRLRAATVQYMYFTGSHNDVFEEVGQQNVV